MDGVTILSQYLYKEMTLGGLIFLITMLVMAFFAMMSVVYNISGDASKSNTFKQICNIALLAFGLFVVEYAHELKESYDNQEVHMNYIVSIDETVNFDEFIEHYEIIDSRDNGLYLVKERNLDNAMD